MKLFAKKILIIFIAVLLLVSAGCQSPITEPDHNDSGNRIIIEDINELYDNIAQVLVRNTPGMVLNLPAPLRDLWLNADIPVFYDDIAKYAEYREILDYFASIDRTTFTPEQLVNLEIAEWFFENQLGQDDFLYNEEIFMHSSPGFLLRPYYFLMDFPLETPNQVELYLEILAQADALLDQPNAAIRARLEGGYLPPAFVADQLASIDLTPPSIVGKLAAVKGEIDKLSGLSADEKDLMREVVDEAELIYQEYSIELQQLLGQLQQQTTVNSGLWLMPNGKEYYTQLLRSHSTVDISPQEVHELGLQEVARIQGEIRKALNELGYQGMEVNEALAILEQKNRLSVAEVKQESQKIIDKMYIHLPDFFDVMPQATVAVEIDPDSFFRAVYTDNTVMINPNYFNTRHMLPAVVIHEGVPGHHLQLRLHQENPEIPQFRNMSMRFTGFIEGWALYAERLAYKYGYMMIWRAR